ncbi:hypothetical protein BAUCODRAFT_32907 [Baudoinia panamericana UAMH 10762]|uniref:non-specific serine/threonine protein kinase n=1 Tax=Baudoinia panamericana (strain UAMH 10762) TaxID=717646 RepID=M2MZV1_BAUPA|nr:uncharacterized protein BAUCODRAFT_32907 [Baudoinia panamericana UAMH 10762]EMC97163.1 hypothetical protein BAUCODRAFT_32907 [Baudoinia panamericana UAMH 10762]
MELEYCSAGDLRKFLIHWTTARGHNNAAVPEHLILHYICSMTRGLGYIHNGVINADTGETVPNHEPMVHGDIKLDNVFLRWPTQPNYDLPDIVLGDFGMAQIEHRSVGTTGTTGYYPPEVRKVLDLEEDDPEAYDRAIVGRIMTRASDIYTFAATLCGLIFNVEFDNRDDAFELESLEDFFQATQYARTLPWLWEMVRRCLAEEPAQRLEIAELLGRLTWFQRGLREAWAAGMRVPLDSWPVIASHTEE